MSNFSGKTALVTGASRGIGRASALAFVPRFSNRPVHRSWCPRTLESLTRSDGYPDSAYEVVTVQLSYSTTQMYE
jgi:NAD(P)-dependent dehydrogenase (short-subunit alcohol dehydrogenase family)